MKDKGHFASSLEAQTGPQYHVTPSSLHWASKSHSDPTTRRWGDVLLPFSGKDCSPVAGGADTAKGKELGQGWASGSEADIR